MFPVSWELTNKEKLLMSYYLTDYSCMIIVIGYVLTNYFSVICVRVS